MNHPKQRHGNHTWDLIQEYHHCPSCSYIFENREKAIRRFHIIEKKLVCPRCAHSFVIIKNKKPSFGPLLGHDPEVDE